MITRFLKSISPGFKLTVFTRGKINQCQERQRERERRGGGRTQMKETAGRQICCRAFNQNKPQEGKNWTAGSEELNRWFDWEETEDWTQTNERMRCRCRNTGEGNEKKSSWLTRKNTRNRAGWTKTMQSRCGRRKQRFERLYSWWYEWISI